MSDKTVNVYLDVANLAMNGGFGMRYDVLREYACCDDYHPMRLNAYVSFDQRKASDDYEYKQKQIGFQQMFRDFGYKVLEKRVKYFEDENGDTFRKANADIDLAVDALTQCNRPDKVILGTGDGDFVRLVEALQNRGCKVEVIGFDNVSADLKRAADSFISGYLIPYLLPTKRNQHEWGEMGSRVRGVCYSYKHDSSSGSSGFGFFRFMRHMSTELWRTDSRDEESPFEGVFFHRSAVDSIVNINDLPNRELIFEFDLAEPKKGHDGFQAANVEVISPYPGSALSKPKKRTNAPVDKKMDIDEWENSFADIDEEEDEYYEEDLADDNAGER